MKIKISTQIAVIAKSKWTFVVLLGLFVAQAAFIAVNSGFPMAFDEQYHFTLIQYYASHLSPFIAHQPDSLSVVGDATRTPSYLFHYALSVPLRAVELITDNYAVQIAVLRFVNIAFVVAALVVFRRFMLRMTNSSTVTNLAILLYCLLPVTSFLAGQINYDNALLFCFALLLLITQRLISGIKAGDTVSIHTASAFISVVLLGCLVKFTFLPIAMSFFVGVAIYAIYKRAWPSMNKDFLRQINMRTACAILLCLVSVGLFAERYGVNMVQYHTLQPDCAAVQPLKTCMQYGVWARNYNLKQNAPSDVTFEGRSPQGYVKNIWIPMMTRGLLGVDRKGNTPNIPIVETTLTTIAALLCAGVITMLLYRRSSLVILIVAATGLYTVALLLRNYSEFMQFHEAVAVQGRYILPFVIPITAIGVLGLADYARRIVHVGHSLSDKFAILKELEMKAAYEWGITYAHSKIWHQNPET
jgi:hypothetical protein